MMRLIIPLTLLLGACSVVPFGVWDNPHDPQGLTPEAQELSLDQTELNLTWNGVSGSRVTVTANLKPDAAADRRLVWTLGDGSVAAIVTSGVRSGEATDRLSVEIAAMAAGVTELGVATPDGRLKATVAVRITDIRLVTGISISAANHVMPNRGLLQTASIYQLSASVQPADATDAGVVWSSSNEAIATVDAMGLVSAVSAGSCDIVVTSHEGGYRAVCRLTVGPALGEVGQAGGWVFAYNPNYRNEGWTWMEAAPSDYYVAVNWRNNSMVQLGAGQSTGTDIGTGKENTSLIVSVFFPYVGEFAAKVCDDYTAGLPDIKTDWYLPSKAELNELHKVYVAKGGNGAGGFSTSKEYWTSTAYDADHAWSQWFDDDPADVDGMAAGLYGVQGFGATMETGLWVRPVRRY